MTGRTTRSRSTPVQATRPAQQAMVVVLEPGAGDTDAANVRGGLRAMRSVVQVTPLDGLGTGDALDAIRRDVLGASLAEHELVRAQRDELAARLAAVQNALTEPLSLSAVVETSRVS